MDYPGGSSEFNRGTEVFKVYVRASNIGHEIQSEELREAFKEFGEIKDVWVARSPSGFAFVHFIKQDDAQAAITAMNGKELKGCTLQVEMSRGRQRDPSSVKPGDWKCTQCNVNNFARRDSCYRCQAPKPSEGGGGRGGGRGRSRSPRRDRDDRGRGRDYDDYDRGRRYDDRDDRGRDRDDDRGRDYGRGERRRSRSR